MAAMEEPLRFERAERIGQRFAVLTDPTRLLILDSLSRDGEAAVGEIAVVVGTTQQNASKHLKILYTERFVARRKLGTSTLYRVPDAALLSRLVAAVAAG